MQLSTMSWINFLSPFHRKSLIYIVECMTQVLNYFKSNMKRVRNKIIIQLVDKIRVRNLHTCNQVFHLNYNLPIHTNRNTNTNTNPLLDLSLFWWILIICYFFISFQIFFRSLSFSFVWLSPKEHTGAAGADD